jgi:hypothetical protein
MIYNQLTIKRLNQKFSIYNLALILIFIKIIANDLSVSFFTFVFCANASFGRKLKKTQHKTTLKKK